MNDLIQAFEEQVASFASGSARSSEAAAWLLSLQESHESCLFVCRSVLGATGTGTSSSPSPTSLFVAMKLLHATLRRHGSNPAAVLPLLPSHEALLGALSCTASNTTVADAMNLSLWQRQLCLSIAVLIVVELSLLPSSTTANPSEESAQSVLLQQLVHYASQYQRSLVILNTVLQEIPNELKLLFRSSSSSLTAKNASYRVAVHIKSMVLTSFAASMTMKSSSAVKYSAIRCLTRWCGSGGKSEEEREGKKEDDEDDEDEEDEDADGDQMFSSSNSVVVTFSDLTRRQASTPTIWELLLDLLREAFSSAACFGRSDGDGNEGGAHCIAETVLQLISELIVYQSPSESHLASYSEADRLVAFYSARSIAQLFVTVAGLWDGCIVQGGLAQWSQALYAGLPDRPPGSASLFDLPKGLLEEHDNGSLLLVLMVEITALLAERHHVVLMDQQSWYVEVRREAGVSSDVDNTARGIMACLTASLALPSLKAALGCTEILTYIPATWSEQARPALQAAVGSIVTVLTRQLVLPSSVSQRQALELEHCSRTSTTFLAKTEEDSEAEDAWQVFFDMRKECEGLLHKIVSTYPGGERILLSVHTVLLSDLDILNLAVSNGSGNGSDGGKEQIELLAGSIECLEFLWASLVEGCMEVDLKGLLSETPTSPPPPQYKFLPASNKNAGKEVQALRLLQMSADIAGRVDALASAAPGCFPLLQFRCLHLWSVLPDVVGFSGSPSIPSPAPHAPFVQQQQQQAMPSLSINVNIDDLGIGSAQAQIETRSVLNLLCACGSTDFAPLRKVAMDALLAITGDSGGLRPFLTPYAELLCNWLSERVSFSTTARIGSGSDFAFSPAYSERLHLCLGRLVSLTGPAEARERRVAAKLNELLSLLNALSTREHLCASDLAETSLACSRHLLSLQGFIRGLGAAASPTSSTSSRTSMPAVEVASSAEGDEGSNSTIRTFAPVLYAGLFTMLEMLCGVLMSGPRTHALDLVAGLANSVASVTGRLLEVHHTEGVVAECLLRVKKILLSFLEMKVPICQGIAALAVVLVRQSSEYAERLLEPAFDLSAAALLSLQLFHGVADAADGQQADFLDYAGECLRLVRQVCATQPVLLCMERAVPSTPSIPFLEQKQQHQCSLAFLTFQVLQRLLAGFVFGGPAFEFHTTFVRSVNLTLAALVGLPIEVRRCVTQALLRSGPVDLMTPLIVGCVLQQHDARLVKHFAMFFESTVNLLAQQQLDDEALLSAVLVETCKRIGESGATTSDATFLQALFQNVHHAASSGNRIRASMATVRKWVVAGLGQVVQR